ncbi:hypothetical protein SmJEL517_g05856 [Synchytrium microbalum]|uniref:RING-type domain-containing protein n=1 Tax=Synchytrium microbalum TaxID=1806994 RepID=A0A507BZC5_9FUNG|nr:uncharacterized protein SmJEL517_g05856 [Synchytrium microbalum]TPX30623.1 hypothetical protein SmJEL517_g05856 [Synchytrium microbalum]
MSRRTISVISSDSIADRSAEVYMAGIDALSQVSSSPTKQYRFGRQDDTDDDEDEDDDDGRPIIDLDAARPNSARQFGLGMEEANNGNHSRASSRGASGSSLLQLMSSSPTKGKGAFSKRTGYINGVEVRNRDQIPSASTLAMLESRFHSLQISQADLAFAPIDVVFSSADGMRMLEADLLRLIQSSEDTTLKAKADALLASVLQEADMYEAALKAQDMDEPSRQKVLRHFPSTSDILPYSTSRHLSRTPSTDTLASRISTTSTIRQVAPSIASSVKPRVPLRDQISPRPPSVATQSSANYTDSSFPAQSNTSGSGRTPPGPNDVFQWTPFSKISDHVCAESIQATVGIPSVIAVSGWIVIGTSRSALLVYDLAQTLHSVLGDNQSMEYGAVTSLSISSDQSTVAAGYGAGFVVVWDIQRRIVMRVLPPVQRLDGRKDGHMPGASIIHVGFVGGSKAELVSADNQGAAFLHIFSKMVLVNTVTSVRIHGRPDALGRPIVPSTIYAMTAMSSSKHILEQHGLIALSTPYKMAVLTTRPVPQILFKLSWTPEEERTTSASLAAKQAVPCACLAWSPLVASSSQLPGRPVTDALHLAASSGFKLYVMRVTASRTRTLDSRRATETSLILPQFVVLGEWLGPENIVAIQWLNPQLVLLMTNHQDLIVFDIATMQAVERSTVHPRKVVTHDYFSKALAFSELACYSSIRMFKGRIFVLGQEDVSMIQLVKWSDRLNSLARTGNFTEALALGCDFYSGSYRRAAGSLPADDAERRRQVSSQVKDLLTTYVDMSLHSYEPHQEDGSSYKHLATVCFETCIAVNRQDFLLTEIFEKFSDADLEGVYFEMLEDYATRERLTNVSHPAVIKAFIEYYKSKGWLARAEQVIFQLDPSSIDVHGVLKLCKASGLYNALIFVYNRALKDYISPIVEILTILAENEKTAGKRPSTSNTESANGDVGGWAESAREDATYALYVYLAYVLTGKAFPVGILPPKEALKAKTDVYNFLFSLYHAFWPPEGVSVEATLLRLGDPPFPYVRLLFRHDPREFLKFIGQAFEDPSLEGEIPAKDIFGLNRPGGYHVRDEVSRQSVADTLLLIVEDDVLTADKVAVYAFLARNYARYTTFLAFPDDVLKAMVTDLSMYKDDGSRNERQNAVMVLLERWKYSKTSAFLIMFEEAGFWKICEAQYRQDEQYDKVLDCYLNDSVRTAESFMCIRELLSDKSILYSDRMAVRSKVMSSLVQLVQIDAEKTAEIISQFFPDAHSGVISQLAAASSSGHVEYEWMYLRGLLVPQRPSLIRNETMKLPTEIYERYVELLAVRNSESVLPYLIHVTDESEGYPFDLQRMFQACRSHNITEAAVWILERSGDIHGALSILLEGLKESSQEAVYKEIQAAKSAAARQDDNPVGSRSSGHSMRESSVSPERGAIVTEDRRLRMEARRALSKAQDSVEAATELCRRAATRLTRPDREGLWFQLLDVAVQPQQLLLKHDGDEVKHEASVKPPKNDASHKRMLESFKALSRAVMSGMIGQVALQAILRRLVVAQPQVPLGEHRALLEEMLAGHIHERETLVIAGRIAASDVDTLEQQVVSLRVGGIRPSRATCGICKKLLGVSSSSSNVMHQHNPDNILVYKCRHAYHETCMKDVWVMDVDVECVLCRNPAGVLRKKSDFLSRLPSPIASPDRGKGKEKASEEDETAEGMISKEMLVRVEALTRFHSVSRTTPTAELLTVLSPNERVYDLDDETSLFAAAATTAVFSNSQSFIEEDSQHDDRPSLPAILSKTRMRHQLLLSPPHLPAVDTA